MLFQEEKESNGKRKKINRLGNILQFFVKKNGKERIRSRSCRLVLVSPICKKWRRLLPEKVSPCASFQRLRRASLAVETALVLPLFFLGMITMISFMDIYKVQTEHLSQLCERTKKAGMYAYVTGGGGPEEITLPDVYTCKLVGGLIPLPEVRMWNSVKVHAWTGTEYDTFDDGAGAENTEEMVYVTASGSVYHKSADCSYLKLSVSRVSGNAVSAKRNTYGEKYHACETCSRNQKAKAVVYITDTGNRYHNLGTCSGLKRTVMLVKHSEAGEMAACSRCG